MIGIYGIFRKSDDKCMYVGQSKDINVRIKSHLSGNATNTSFNKEEYYGDVIEEHMINDKQFRLEREAYWIEQLNPELNVVRDETKRGEYYLGEKNRMFGKHFSDEHKKHLSESCKGRPAWNKGISPSEETKKKISEAVSGEKHPMFGKPSWNKGLTKEKQPCYGTKWINNGTISKRVNQDELDKYIQDGWKPGMIK